MVGLLTVVSPRVGYATPDEQAEIDRFYLLIHALRYAAGESGYDEDSPLVSPMESLVEWLVSELVNPNTPSSQEQARDREALLENLEHRFPATALEDILVYLRKYDLLSHAIIEALTGWHIERIAELTNDTPERVRGLLTERVALTMSDRAALVALYHATNGDDWRNNGNWLSDDVPIYRWHGVDAYVQGYIGRVFSLNLSDNGLAGEIPPEIGDLSALHHLDLSDNGLTGEIPSEIGSLARLLDLDLSHNSLHGQIPIGLGNLSNLRWLNIRGNRFTGCAPDDLYDMEFYIPHDPFGWRWPISFGSVHNLGLPRCGQMSALVALYNATDGDNWTNNMNWLSAKPISEWHGVTTYQDYEVVILELDDDNQGVATDRNYKVVGLELDDNNLRGQIPPELDGLASLERLHLFGNRLSGDIPTELGNLPNLESLSLGGNRLSGCLPDGLSYVPRIDISALGVPFCGSGASAPAPSLALAAFSPSPTEMNLFWLNSLEAESAAIYRNGALVATPPIDQSHFIESGLSPNARYEYRIEANLADGSKQTAESSAATLARYPRMAEPMYIDESGFKLPIVDIHNPPETEYRGAISTWYSPLGEEQEIITDWDSSRCITFEGLKPGMVYDLESVARNLDGIESEPSDWTYGEYTINATWSWGAQTQPGNDYPWAIYKINEAAALYELTEAARLWMLSDIRVKFYRNEPGYAAYHPDESIAGLGNALPGTVMHEVMHGFINHWTGFPLPCDVMNIYTLKRDIAGFLLDFRDYDRAGQPNPLEDWRPFYNRLVGIQPDYSSQWGKGFWEILEQGEYHELRALYHQANAGILDLIAGKMSLLPTTLRPYFEGFLTNDSDSTTWREELYWYTSLPLQERRLWDTAYNYHGALHHSPQYAAPPYAPRTSIPAEKRELLRNADRRMLVDFINTLEDISCNTQCVELWRADFDFWMGYVHRNLYRARLYVEELSADTGVELAPANLDAVKGVLRTISSSLSCGSASPSSYLRRHINSATGISELQRNAFLAMVDVLERDPGWYPSCRSDAALVEAWTDIQPNKIVHDHPAPVGRGK